MKGYRLAELKMLEREAVQLKVEPEIVKTETEALRDLARKVERASRSLYMKFLERGLQGSYTAWVEHYT